MGEARSQPAGEAQLTHRRTGRGGRGRGGRGGLQQIIRSFAKVDRNVYKTTNESASIHTYQILLSKNRHDLSQVFLIRLKLRTMRWSCMVKSASFSTDNGQTSRFSFFYRINFLTIKFSSQNISITLALTDSALTSRGDRIGEKSSRERFCKNSSRCQKILL